MAHARRAAAAPRGERGTAEMQAALRDIEAQLNKKATFEAAARRLAATLTNSDAPLSAEERTVRAAACGVRGCVAC